MLLPSFEKSAVPACILLLCNNAIMIFHDTARGWDA